MKRSLFLVLLLSAFSLNAEDDMGVDAWVGDFPPDEIVVGEEAVFVESVFVPKGFDSKDNVEIIATGWKPSPCYGTPRPTIEKVGDEIKVTLTSSKRVGRDRICIDMAQHFQVTVPLRQVPAGHYNIVVNPNTDAMRISHLDVAIPTNNSLDDFLYADVDSVTVDPKTRIVTMQGENSSPCLELDRVLSTSNGQNTYAVMPIMRKKDAICPQVLTPFTYTYELPSDLHADKLLVHVRTVHGRSKNKIFTALR